MKLKIALLTLLALFAIPLIYLKWPQLTQVYRPGTCLKSKSTSEIFYVETFADNFLGFGPRAKILKANPNTLHQAGDFISITDGDKNLEKIDCDKYE